MSAVNVFVAAIYADQWYFGKVTEIDIKDNEVQVVHGQCRQVRQTYKWPRPSEKDEIWNHERNILKKISSPKAAGKTSQFF